MSLLELFRFLMPYFAAVSDADVQKALDVAAEYRPACLSTAKQDEAQVYYAAWFLYQRQMQTAALQAPIPYGVKSEREGDVSRTYGTTDPQADPFGWWDQYATLRDLCGGGAITVGHRHGSPCGCFH